MTDVLKELRQWAATLPFWEQAALDKILAGGEITEADCDQFLQYLLEDAGLAETVSERPELQFLNMPDIEVETTETPARLVSVSNLRNVNALIPGQTLAFSPVLTVIYGGTGSGKSGYSRMIGCAGFTRGDDYVLPDVTQPLQEGMTPSAKIEIELDGEVKTIDYQVGDHYPELGCFYMLDSAAARVHLTKSNTITFSPYGLSSLAELADITDRVRERLQAKIDKETTPRDFGSLFQGESETRNLVTNLSSQTDLAILRSTATLTEEEQKRFEELDIEIAKLKTEDVSEEIKYLIQTIGDLEILSQHLGAATKTLSDDVIGNISSLITSLNDLKILEQDAGIAQFQSPQFTQTGTNAWLQFIRAARDLAQAEDELYPTDGDHCLLCQQPLQEHSLVLMHRLWEFLEAGISTKLTETQASLNATRETISNVELDFFDAQSVSYRHLQRHDVVLLDAVSAFVEVCGDRRDEILATIDNLESRDLGALPDNPITGVQNVVETLKTSHQELEQRDLVGEATRLQIELAGLQHRVVLAQHLPEIEAYVQRLIWAEKANDTSGSTRHITKKHGDLFKGLVTQHYMASFRKTLEDLGCQLKVEIRTRGSKGKRFKELTLQMDPSAPEGATPDTVLSEGEKRAVALADFLTEVSLDNTCATIVLDDPVTSLDADWKDTIASRVLAEAQRRQVVVFTHDLTFLYLLKKYAEVDQIEVASHWIKRGDIDDKPGYVWLNNSPAHDRDYRSAAKAREWHQKALDASPESQENILKSGFGALRTSYEAFIILDMFNEVVLRFDARISPGRLKGIVWDDSIVTDVLERQEILSRYIEGHWHSDISPSPAATPKMLLEEIEHFEELRDKLKGLKRAKS